MSARSRLLLLTPDYPPATGGVQKLLHRLVGELCGFDPTVITRDCDGAVAWDAAQPYRVRRAGRAGSKIGLLGPVIAGSAEGLRAGTDIVVAGHVSCVPAALMLRRVRGVPFVFYLYADELPNHRRVMAAGMRGAAVTIAISRHTRDLAAQLGGPIDRTVIIPPGVDLPEHVPGPEARQPGLVVTVARLRDPYKGHDMMLAALARLRSSVPGLHWVVIGDGPLRAELEALSRELGVADLVTFAGRVADWERDAWLDRAQVFAMPSRLPPGGLGGEGFGIVYLEAAAHGLPVVAGAVAGALDAVRDGQTGLLVDPSSPEALAAGLERIMTDRTFAGAMAAAARRHAATFAYPEIGRRVGEVLTGALQ
jgi:phosphatidyl-myo-inositol dimannoside synthase